MTRTPTRRPAAAEPIEDTMRTALRHHHDGRLQRAAALYRRVLEARPEHPDALHFLGLVSHQSGRHDRAVSLIRQAIAADGGVATYHHNMGEAYRALGRLDEAVAAYRQSLALDDGVADCHFALANVCYDLGRHTDAIEHYRQAIALAPEDAEAHNNLGNALLETGDAAGAAASYRQALAVQPTYAQAEVNLGNLRFEEGAHAAAIAHYRRALAIDVSLADALVNLGNALVATGEPAEARSAYQRAIALEPALVRAHISLGDLLKRDGELSEAAHCFMRAIDAVPDGATPYNKLGNVLQELRRSDEALAAFGRALELNPDFAEAACNLANVLIHLGKDDEAVPHLERAIRIKPDLAAGYYGLGVCRQQTGRFDEAVRLYRQALAREPDFAEALLNLALNQAAELNAAERERLEAMLEGGQVPEKDRINLNFALARVWEGEGEYDRAFAFYSAANALKAREVRVDPETQSQRVMAAIATFPRTYFEERAGVGSPSELPVFVLGMPRSGTTLVEQIIASHPRAFGAGELPTMRHLVDEMPAALHTDLGYPECARLIDGKSAAGLAQRYLEELRTHAPDADRITDKLPLNFLRLGLIAVLLPRARIIHCRREPLDICISCFSQNFRSLNFTTDLRTLGSFYRDYERIMAHWRAVLPIPVLEVAYEALIAEPEPVTRRIVAFCGLDWDPRCLAFHEHERQIRTASFWQARQPLYASSVGRWRHYERHLGPLIEALGAAAHPPS